MMENAKLFIANLLIISFVTDQIYRYYHGVEAKKRYAVKTKKLSELIETAPKILLLSGMELGKLIKEGKITSLELTLKCIEQLEKTNLYTNGLVASRYDRAISEARERDEKLIQHRKNGTLPSSPFYGVPLMSKEAFELPDMPFSVGVVALKNRYGKNTSYALQKAIEEGGVVVLGVGNTSEQCMWMESSNKVYGKTNNVYDASRTVGGSSGGTACIVSALGAPLAITSDVGGSTRIPSLYNGLFGLKPTGGIVSNENTTPKVMGRVNWFCQLGPCSRHAEDLLPLLKIMVGPSPIFNPACKEYQTKTENFSLKWISDEVSLKDMKIFDCPIQAGSLGPLGPFQRKRDKSMIECHKNLIDYFQSKGHTIHDTDFKELEEGFDIWSAYLLEAQDTPFREILAEGKENAGSLLWAIKELLIWIFSLGRFSDHTLPGLALAVAQVIEGINIWKIRRLIQKGEKLKLKISAVLKENGVLIVPSLPTPAPHHGPVPFIFRGAETAATSIFNVLEFPSCAVPLGLNEEGLPIGVQILSNYGNEHLCLSVAKHLEKVGIAKYEIPRLSRKEG